MIPATRDVLLPVAVALLSLTIAFSGVAYENRPQSMTIA